MVSAHQPVLMQEALAGLAIKDNGIYIDGTFGRGGHSRAILEKLGEGGQLLAFDKDPEAIKVAHEGTFRENPRFCAVAGSFTQIEQYAQDRGLSGKVNGILLDLGVSSPQLDDPARGFSFLKEGPLDMRMDLTQSLTAETWVNRADAEEIASVLREYGEERFAKRIARRIVEKRMEQRITTTTQLSALITDAIPKWEKHKHPATRSFQAIRIFINNELEELRVCLEQCLKVLAMGGRLCVISFHSLEDRVVKQFFQHRAYPERDLPSDFPIRENQIHREIRLIGSLIRPSLEEIAINPRARSARLRIVEKLL